MTAAPSGKQAVVVIGGGPAGLMAAEAIAAAGFQPHLYDAMPSVGRKFLLAGKGGLNLTHSEPLPAFAARYGARAPDVTPLLRRFPPEGLRSWSGDLGIATFIGTSGRVFPDGMKAAPLLRAWLTRMRATGVSIHVRHRWTGIVPSGPGRSGALLQFATPTGPVAVEAETVVFALGGASWPHLGSDGAWAGVFSDLGVAVKELVASNCGFDVNWSEHFRTRFAGVPVKSVRAAFRTPAGEILSQTGEFVVTASGIEGGLVYALSAPLRDAIARDGPITLMLDLLPGKPVEALSKALERPRGRRTLANLLRSRLGIDGVKAGLVRETTARSALENHDSVAQALKALPLRLERPRPVAEAISTAGGIDFAALDAALMSRQLPGIFFAGEMLDWEAPTGGYLLSACFASGKVAGEGAVAWLRQLSQ